MSTSTSTTTKGLTTEIEEIKQKLDEIEKTLKDLYDYVTG